MYPADKEPDYRQAFAAAEEAWMQWSTSSSRDLDDPDLGHRLLEEFMYTARAYCNHVERQTARLMYLTGPAGSGESQIQSDNLEIPGFLRRLTD